MEIQIKQKIELAKAELPTGAALTLDNYLNYLNFSDSHNSIYLPVNLIPVSME
jgi:hypothetical protein